MSIDSLANESPDPPAPNQTDFLTTRIPSSWLQSRLEKLTGILSPILLKEARQAIKSRQLSINLFLLFLFAIGWAFACLIYSQGDHIDAVLTSFAVSGFAYGLAFPLMIVVPFWSFFSMANEIEDSTYDLILCTSLKPWQIVAGKLSAALAQILIYLAVLAPCFTFCAVLPGTDLYQLFFCICSLTAFGFGLSALGLLLGSPRSSVWRVLALIAFFGILVLCFVGTLIAISVWLNEGSRLSVSELDEPEFSIFVNLFIVAAMGPVSLGLLFASIAVGAVSPVSSNRSTVFRLASCLVWVVVATVLIVPTYYWFHEGLVMVQNFYMAILALMVGGWLVGESPQLSQRVRRQIPRRKWIHSLTCWFLPGPGRGFVFALSLIAGFFVLISVHAISMEVALSNEFGPWGGNTNNEVHFVGPDNWDGLIFYAGHSWIYTTYVGAFLTTTWFIATIFRAAGVQLNCLLTLVITAGLVTMSIMMWGIIELAVSRPRSGIEFQIHDVLNAPFVAFDFSSRFDIADDSWWKFGRAVYLTPIPTLLTFIGLFCASREMLTKRSAKPRAVIEDDAALRQREHQELSFDEIE